MAEWLERLLAKQESLGSLTFLPNIFVSISVLGATEILRTYRCTQCTRMKIKINLGSATLEDISLNLPHSWETCKAAIF